MDESRLDYWRDVAGAAIGRPYIDFTRLVVSTDLRYPLYATYCMDWLSHLYMYQPYGLALGNSFEEALDLLPAHLGGGTAYWRPGLPLPQMFYFIQRGPILIPLRTAITRCENCSHPALEHASTGNCLYEPTSFYASYGAPRYSYDRRSRTFREEDRELYVPS